MNKLLITYQEEKKTQLLSTVAADLFAFLRENNGYALYQNSKFELRAISELLSHNLIEQSHFGIKLTGCNIVRTPDADPRGDGFTVHYYRSTPKGDRFVIQRLRGCAEKSTMEYFVTHQSWGSKDQAITFPTEKSCGLTIDTLPPARLYRPFQKGDCIQTRVARLAGVIVLEPDNPEAASDGTVIEQPQHIILTGVVREVEDDGYGWLSVDWQNNYYANPMVFVADADMYLRWK